MEKVAIPLTIEMTLSALEKILIITQFITWKVIAKKNSLVIYIE